MERIRPRTLEEIAEWKIEKKSLKKCGFMVEEPTKKDRLFFAKGSKIIFLD